ncbi:MULTISPECIES: NAD(P)-dependent oxidoreductase [unclassified Bradyrhizobium]|uniref:NAD(P)-dependent oxidoreductase n=1 Tax=unclassified Bradyrhizobium TaxID=2631580 RepID=UPI002012D60B|nr:MULTISPECIES: NAD(P)-binding oxidoreductase [unclassified Bradyrhizobium]
MVVLGATGTTGGLVVDEALAAGHDVTAFVRNAGAVTPRQRLTVVSGSIEDEAAMCKAFVGADTVISCLGARVTVGTLLRGTDFQRRMLPKVISAINQAGVKRFVLMSSFGVGETAAKASLLPRILFYYFIAKRLFDDKSIAEQALSRCEANWTAVYPVSLWKGPPDPAWDLVALNKVRNVPGLPKLAFATVAKVLVALASDQTQAGQKLLQTVPGGWR